MKLIKIKKSDLSDPRKAVESNIKYMIDTAQSALNFIKKGNILNTKDRLKIVRRWIDAIDSSLKKVN